MTRVVSLFIVVSLLHVLAVGAQTDSTFTYQGQLRENGSPFDGSLDMNFSLWDSPTGGGQVGNTVMQSAVNIIAGSFALELDFGPSVFDNSERWLEIEVQGNTLVPRQLLTRTPYSIQTRGIFVDELGNIGLGTTQPASHLHIKSIGQDNNGIDAPFRITSDSGLEQLLLDGNEIDAQFDRLYLNNNTTQDVVIAGGGGRVGIGTSEPEARLHVESDSGFVQFHAHHTSTLGFTVGVLATSDSTNGLAVWGRNVSPCGPSIGIFAQSNSDCGTALFAEANAATGQNIAVSGFTRSDAGYAAYMVGGRNYFDGDVGIGTAQPQTSLHVVGGSGLTLTSGGYVQYGDTETANLAFDDNEIMARNNGSANNMFLNRQGGNVAIGTGSPNFKLHVNGSAGKPGGGSWSNASDQRLKKDIRDLEGALASVLELRGVTFEYVDPGKIDELAGRRIGMIAQEVEAVFPDWVDVRADGYLALTYRGFEALMVEALRELRDEKDTEMLYLRRENEALRQRLARLERLVEAKFTRQADLKK